MKLFRTRSLQYLSIFLFAIGTILVSCNKQPNPEHQYGKIAEKGMVVSAHPEASRIGKEILQKGGNAVDAACAVELALAVSYPVAGNIGGGGFMVIRFDDGVFASVDYREKAPALASKNMYLDENNDVVPGLSTDSHLAVGVPGTVSGVLAAHSKYGKLDFKEIIQPSVDLAVKGFPVTEKQAGRLNNYKNTFLRVNDHSIPFVKEEDWMAGDTLRQPELAHTLELIRDHGAEGFYSGETAEEIIRQMEKGNGLITFEDLENYQAVWRKPLTGNYKDYEIISMAPPSSGGIALLQLLGMTEPFSIDTAGFHDAQTIHLMVEAEKRVYADRAEFLGDPDHYSVPVDELLDNVYIRDRMNDYSSKKATPSENIRHGQPTPPESEETTHYSIVDPFGNAVAGTTTLNRGYGTKIVVEGAGFFLNNEMDDFSSKPGFPNSFGLVGGEANSIQPEKRMLSSMTPTILEKDGELYMVLGSPGGSTIITSVFQTILNVVDHGMTMQEAVASSRFHHQWLPDHISYEKNSLSDSLVLLLQNMGHKMQERNSIGRVDAILRREDGSLEAGADPRGDDTAEGF